MIYVPALKSFNIRLTVPLILNQLVAYIISYYSVC